jgi:hypothetical protein
MAAHTGQNMYIEFAGVELTGAHRSFDVSESVSTANTTSGADTDESHIVTTSSGDFQLTLLNKGTAIATARQALSKGASGTLIYGLDGTATGQPKYSCVVTVTERSFTTPYDGEAEIEVTFLKNGAWLLNYEENGDTWA